MYWEDEDDDIIIVDGMPCIRLNCSLARAIYEDGTSTLFLGDEDK